MRPVAAHSTPKKLTLTPLTLRPSRPPRLCALHRINASVAQLGLATGVSAQPAHNASTSEQIKTISDRIAAIESDLGISGDVMDNYPVITPGMRSLMAKNITPKDALAALEEVGGLMHKAKRAMLGA